MARASRASPSKRRFLCSAESRKSSRSRTRKRMSSISDSFSPRRSKSHWKTRSKVLDFGLAKAVEAPEEGSSGSVEADASTIGSRAYPRRCPTGNRGLHEPRAGERQGASTEQTEHLGFRLCLLRGTHRKECFPRTVVIRSHCGGPAKKNRNRSALPSTTPSSISASFFRRCIDKDPSRRLHDIADARIEISRMPWRHRHGPSRSTRISADH